MKIYVYVIFIILSAGCSKNVQQTDWKIGEGIEFYLTEIPVSHSYLVDYSKLDLDLIPLEGTPLIRYNDIKNYFKKDHTVELNITNDKISLGQTGINGKMFIVTLDKNPVYCGFYWPVYSSAACNYVFLQFPLPADGMQPSNKINLTLTNTGVPDLKAHSGLMDRLKSDGKIIE
jgi:hypothetical protein